MAVGSVRSADGTTIAFERTGDGPPVILIGGAFQDRGSLAPLAAELAPSLTAYTYDRRGRGGSGDTPPYAVGREIEDLRALVAEAGGTAGLFGVSSGAILALETAAAGAPLTRVAAFEPPYLVDDSRPAQSAALAGEVAELTGAGRRGDGVELFLRKGVGLAPEVIAQMRASETWPALERIAPTLVYDATITGDGVPPVDRLATIGVPVLVVDSTGSAPWLRTSAAAVADTIPGATRRPLPGGFHDVPPPVLAKALIEFFVS
jgi:alpha-beta hydrolase superfamily lysophospholipase